MSPTLRKRILVFGSPAAAATDQRPIGRAMKRRCTMQPGQIVAGARTFGYVAMLAAGLALGTAVPVRAETATSDASLACGTVNAADSLLATTAAPAASTGIAAGVADPGTVLGNGGRDCTSCAPDATNRITVNAANQDGAAPADTSEWAVPSSPGQPGKPY